MVRYKIQGFHPDWETPWDKHIKYLLAKEEFSRAAELIACSYFWDHNNSDVYNFSAKINFDNGMVFEVKSYVRFITKEIK